MLGVVSLAQFLGMTLWFSATAVTPLLVREFDIPPDHVAWLTMAVQAGFVAGTLASALTNLADILNPRTLMFMGALAGALANAAVIVAPGSTSVIVLRFLTGASLALVYPPGMKIAAGWFRDRRGFALGLLIGALTLGKAFPHLLTAVFGDNWHQPMLLVSALAALGGILVLAVVRDGPFVAATAPFDPARHPEDPGQPRRPAGDLRLPRPHVGALRDVDVDWRVRRRPASRLRGCMNASAAGSLAAFLAIGSGAAGCGMAGYLADRVGKARVAMWAMVASAACAALTVAVFGARALLALRARHGVGLCGGCRLGAVLGAGQRTRAPRTRRHRPHAANVRGVPVDDGHD